VFAPARIPGFEASELGIAAATRGLASVHVLRAREPGRLTCRHDGELVFHFVLRGELTLDDEHRLGAADAFVVPRGRPFAWSDASRDLELLQVALPGEPGLVCA